MRKFALVALFAVALATGLSACKSNPDFSHIPTVPDRGPGDSAAQ